MDNFLSREMQHFSKWPRNQFLKRLAGTGRIIYNPIVQLVIKCGHARFFDHVRSRFALTLRLFRDLWPFSPQTGWRKKWSQI